MKLHVMVEYVGHFINCEGAVTYRHIEIELTKEQQEKLKLHKYEHYGTFSIDSDAE